MGRRGPIPLESGAKALRGNTPGRALTDSVKAPGRVLPAPAWLSEEQREIWRETARSAPRDLIARVDTGVLTTYVIHRHAYEAIAKLCEGKPADLARYADVLSKHQAAMLKASAVLGLDPASRARMRVEADLPKPAGRAGAGSLFDELKEG